MGGDGSYPQLKGNPGSLALARMFLIDHLW